MIGKDRLDELRKAAEIATKPGTWHGLWPVEAIRLLDAIAEMDALDAKKDAEIARLRDALEHVASGGCLVSRGCTCQHYAVAVLRPKKGPCVACCVCGLGEDCSTCSGLGCAEDCTA